MCNPAFCDNDLVMCDYVEYKIMGGKPQDECELYGNIPEHQENPEELCYYLFITDRGETEVAPESIWKERQDTA